MARHNVPKFSNIPQWLLPLLLLAALAAALIVTAVSAAEPVAESRPPCHVPANLSHFCVPARAGPLQGLLCTSRNGVKTFFPLPDRT